jgi:hypothetical protein
MKVYKIYLNGFPSVINCIEGNITDPYDSKDYAFSNGRTAQKVLRDHKRACVQAGLDISMCQFTIVRGEFVPEESDASL